MIVSVEHRQIFVASDEHDALKVPPLVQFPCDETTSEVMCPEVLDAGQPACLFELIRPLMAREREWADPSNWSTITQNLQDTAPVSFASLRSHQTQKEY